MLNRLPIVLFACAMALADFGNADEQAPVSRDSRIWRAVDAANSQNQADERERPNCWAKRIRVSQNAFSKSYQNVNDTSEAISDYVRQFGVHGADADFSWVFANADALLLQSYVGPRKKEPFRKIQLEVCEAEVRHFMKHRKLLGRYYHLLAWSRQFLGSSERSNTRFELVRGFTKRGFAKNGNEDY